MERIVHKKANPISIFLCGDVMTGRGIDQILPNPGDQILHERYMRWATGYVKIAEALNGPINQPVAWDYIWGNALAEFDRFKPDFKIINLETSITKCDQYWKGKGINYRMSPDNIACLTTAEIDVCSLANNHILDWGYAGLTETLLTLREHGMKTVGAGENIREAAAYEIVPVTEGNRVIVFAYGSETSGIPFKWAASDRRPGVNLLPDLSRRTVMYINKKIAEIKQPGDIVIASIHWGGNWGYTIPEEHRLFAQMLIDDAGVDVIHGHSTHHVMGIEVYNNKLILYGCGDIINDYEGISGHQEFRGDLSLMYFADIDPATGSLISLTMVPTQIKRFQLRRASKDDSLWLSDILNREGKLLNTSVEMNDGNNLILQWSK